MATMKALRFEKYGPPSVLSVQELRVPDLKPKEAHRNTDELPVPVTAALIGPFFERCRKTIGELWEVVDRHRPAAPKHNGEIMP